MVTIGPLVAYLITTSGGDQEFSHCPDSYFMGVQSHLALAYKVDSYLEILLLHVSGKPSIRKCLKAMDIFCTGGWGHSLALGGVFPNIKAAIPG